MAISYLFVPAHDDRKVRKALASHAEAVILDLEDAVPDAAKDQARAAVNRTLRDSNPSAVPQLWVRINDSTTASFAADLQDTEWRGAYGAVLPKAEDPAAVKALADANVGHILLLVESAAGLAALGDLVRATDRVERLAIGTWDLALDLGLLSVDDPDDSELIWHVRSELVIASRRLRLDAPIDGIYSRITDVQGLTGISARARRQGYGGKLIVHPNQIDAVHLVFGAAPTSVLRAQELITEYEQAERSGRGAIRVGDQLVDRPMAKRAQAVLARWRETGSQNKR
jgi:citrate lyase subunit beta / citryl-CoA lyase